MITDEMKQRVESYGFWMEMVEDDFGIQRLKTSIKGRAGLFELTIGGEPEFEGFRLVRFDTKVIQPYPGDYDLGLEWFLEWLNAKNSDLNFGRYYIDDKGFIHFECSLPTFNGEVWWEGFDELLRISAFSVDDAMEQLLSIIEELGKGR